MEVSTGTGPGRERGREGYGKCRACLRLAGLLMCARSERNQRIAVGERGELGEEEGEELGTELDGARRSLSQRVRSRS